MEREVVEKLQEHLRPNPEDATQLVFTSANLNGLTSFHKEFFDGMPLSTLRNIVERFKQCHNVIALKGLFRDHCLCPVCADLRAQINLCTEALKHAASNVRILLPDVRVVCLFSKKFFKQQQESYDLKEKVFALKDAFEAHNDLQLLQRAGMNQIRSTLTHLTLASKKRMFHMDAKSKWSLPFFLQEVRGVPQAKFVIQEIGESFFMVPVFDGGGVNSTAHCFLCFFCVWWVCLGFHDMSNNQFLGLLLDESAGNQDSDMIGSLICQLLTIHLADESVEELVLVLDNCGLVFCFVLFCFVQSRKVSHCTSSSIQCE